MVEVVKVEQYLKQDAKSTHIRDLSIHARLSKAWLPIDRKNFTESPFCHRCLKYDIQDHIANPSREHYCTMISRGEKIFFELVEKLGKRRNLPAGKELIWQCKRCAAKKTIMLTDWELGQPGLESEGLTLEHPVGRAKK